MEVIQKLNLFYFYNNDKLFEIVDDIIELMCFFLSFRWLKGQKN